MARIRHIALVVDDSEKTAEFYTSAFGLKEVFRQKNDETRGQWAIYLTDGYINLALLPVERPRAPFRRRARCRATAAKPKRSCAIRTSTSSSISRAAG